MIYKSLGFFPPVYRRVRQYLPVPSVGAVKPVGDVACHAGGAGNCARDGGDCGRAGGVIVCVKGTGLNG